MPELTEIGRKLAALRERSGLSLEKIAQRAGYAGRSSVQRYFDGSFEGDFLPIQVATKLADAMEGEGSPPITRDELIELTAMPLAISGQKVNFGGPSPDPMHRDIPVYGTALGAPRDIEGEAIEQTSLNTGEIITHVKRPVALAGRTGIYGLYIQGSSMSPRFEEGEIVLIDSLRPPRIGDDVVVYLRGPDEHEGERCRGVLIKRLCRRAADYYELEQFNPRRTFRIGRIDVGEVHRVIPWSDIFS